MLVFCQSAVSAQVMTFEEMVAAAVRGLDCVVPFASGTDKTVFKTIIVDALGYKRTPTDDSA